jgi:hypothetical protein
VEQLALISPDERGEGVLVASAVGTQELLIGALISRDGMRIEPTAPRVGARMGRSFMRAVAVVL